MKLTFAKNNLWVLLLLAFVLTAGLAVHKVIAANPPTLKAGTYLQGQTLSVWPSWTVLGNALGEALPTDPLNQLGPAGTCATSTNLFCIDKSQCPNGENCILHDPATGWSTENRRFSFACATSSYAYRYIDISTSTYEVRARLENLGFTVSNWQQFADSFVSSSIVKFYPDMGICSGNPEVSTLSAGKCGDGIINASNNEQCDPPGKLRYGACGASHSNQIKLDVCNSSCQWTPSSTPYVSCSYVSKCGNGIIEAGETCDDGALNGKYNHCNSTCSGKSATYCGDHIVQSTYELCDPGTAADFYAPNRKDSCSWDCQHYGPYCGDGVIQQVPDEIPGALGAVSGGMYTITSKNGNTIQVRELNTSPTCNSDYNGSRVSCSINTWNYSVNFNQAGTYSVQAITSNVSENLTDSSFTGDPSCPAPGIQHHVTVSLDGTTLGSYCADANNTPQNGQTYIFKISTAGQHTVTLNWDNDWTQMNGSVQVHDSNIAINKILLNRMIEECDGTKTCQFNGQQGSINCDSSCKIIYSAAGGPANDMVARWTFDAADILNTTAKDVSGNGNDGIMHGGVTSMPGQFGQSLKFNGSNDYISVATPVGLPAGTTPRTITAWIKGFSTPPVLRSIVGYGTNSTAHLFNLCLGASANKLFFWGSSTNVQGTNIIDPNAWTHVAVSFNTPLVKMYINGTLDAQGTLSSLNTADHTPLNIGGNGPPYSPFDGQIDDVRIYNRALTDAEISTFYPNACTISGQSVNTTTPGTCGDGMVDQGEACDKGIANNGKVCTPAYGKTCSYCSVDCQHTIDVQPKEYCGNGIVEGTEVCDSDLATGKIYVSEVLKNPTSTETDISREHNGYLVKSCVDELQDPNTLKKGTKVCTSDCKTIKLTTGEDNCVKCGVDMVTGVPVEGTIVNALDPLSNNPLVGVTPLPEPAWTDTVNCPGASPARSDRFAQCPETPLLQDSKMNLYMADKSGSPAKYIGGRAWRGKFTNSYDFGGLTDRYNTQESIMLNSNPICSEGDPSYRIQFNDDVSGHWKPFKVIDVAKNGQPWMNDLLLSPTILQSIRPKDMRMVVSWVGNADFYSGFFVPKSSTDYFLLFGGSFPHFATGTFYYQRQCMHAGVFLCALLDLFQRSGIWYHGFNRTPDGTNSESYTIDTGAMQAGQYVFYIKSESGPIKTLAASSKLKVEVYFPETDDYTYYYRHFAVPARSYYLSAAMPSDNPSAEYWQVFNVLQPEGNVVTTSDIFDPNKIVTDPKYFDYKPPCMDRNGDPYPASPQRLCRPAVGDCDQPEYCDGNPTGECPSDVKKSQGAACSASLSGSACYNPAAVCNGSSDSCPAPTLAAAGTVCGSTSNPCLNNPICDGTNYSCPASTNKSDGTSCADLNRCNGNETCQGGTCTAGTPVTCQANTTCTSYICATFSGFCTPIFTGGSCTTGAGYPGNCSFGNCVCTPTTCTAQGKTCGIIPDGCGGTLDCGPTTCFFPPGATCTNNVCSCAPPTIMCGPMCRNCNDNNPCTNDDCGLTGTPPFTTINCRHLAVPAGTPCMHGLIPSSCNATGVCL